jgi:hypothetical protein
MKLKYRNQIIEEQGYPESIDDLFDKTWLFAKEKGVISLFWSIRFSLTVSNTHKAPYRKKTNWYGHKDKPIGYPGWQGRVWIHHEGFNFNSHFELSHYRLFTGSGGGGNYNNPFIKWKDYEEFYRKKKLYPRSWDFRIYMEDFFGEDLVNEVIQYRKIMEAMNGWDTKDDDIRHPFEIENEKSTKAMSSIAKVQ